MVNKSVLKPNLNLNINQAVDDVSNFDPLSNSSRLDFKITNTLRYMLGSRHPRYRLVSY